jgi:hypothetical protein
MPEDSLVIVRRKTQLSEPLPLLRDDEQVGWGLGADVVEYEAVFVLLRVWGLGFRAEILEDKAV